MSFGAQIYLKLAHFRYPNINSLMVVTPVFWIALPRWQPQLCSRHLLQQVHPDLHPQLLFSSFSSHSSGLGLQAQVGQGWPMTPRLTDGHSYEPEHNRAIKKKINKSKRSKPYWVRSRLLTCSKCKHGSPCRKILWQWVRCVLPGSKPWSFWTFGGRRSGWCCLWHPRPRSGSKGTIARTSCHQTPPAN